MMRPYKCSFSSPEEWLGILSSHSFLLPLSLIPILTTTIFLGRGGKEFWRFFPHSTLRTCLLICEQERACRDGRLLQNLIFITVFDLFMTTSYPCLHVLLVSLSLSLPIYQTPPCHQTMVLERETLFSCRLYFAL